MWECSVSRLRSGTPGRLGAAGTGRIGARLALLLGVLAAFGFPGFAAASHSPDSGRTAKRVRAADHGITIEESSRSGKERHRIRMDGDLHVAGHHVRFDSLVVDDNSSRGDIDVEPNIHIETDKSSCVRMFSDVTVDSSEQVDGSVVAMFGNVAVRGRVDGDVVAVFGSVHLAPGSVVDGDAVAIGGRLEQPADATVRGESVSLAFFPLLPGVSPVRVICVVLLAGWVIAILLGGLLSLLAPHRVYRIAETISERTGRSLLLGFFLPPLVVITAVMLMITLIGIPVAILLPMFYLLTLWVGLVASSCLLGCRLMGRTVGEGNLFPPLLLGSIVVAVLFGTGAALAGSTEGINVVALVFAVLGLLFGKVLAIVGSGAVLLSGFGSRRRPSEAGAAASPVTVPPVGGPAPAPASPAPPATA